MRQSSGMFRSARDQFSRDDQRTFPSQICQEQTVYQSQTDLKRPLQSGRVANMMNSHLKTRGHDWNHSEFGAPDPSSPQSTPGPNLTVLTPDPLRRPDSCPRPLLPIVNLNDEPEETYFETYLDRNLVINRNLPREKKTVYINP